MDDILALDTDKGNLDQGAKEEDLMQFVSSLLKNKKHDNISCYEELVLSMVTEEGSFSFNELYLSFKNFRLTNDTRYLVAGFASYFNEAEQRMSIELEDVLSMQAVEKHINSLYFFYNRMRKVELQLSRYQKILKSDQYENLSLLLYELDKLKTDKIINYNGFIQEIIEAYKTGKPLDIVHMKCLRYTYPDGQLVLLEDMDDATISTKNRMDYSVKSESQLFSRINRFLDLLKYYGINPRLNIILADDDLDYFKFVDRQDLNRAEDSVGAYVSAVKREARRVLGANVSIVLMSDLVDNEYCRLFTQIRGLLDNGHSVGKLTQRTLQTQIDRGFEVYKRIMSYPLTRQVVRNFVIERTAGVLSLQHILKGAFSGHCVLIEDSRGNENHYIGTGSDGKLPGSIFFIKLRD